MGFSRGSHENKKYSASFLSVSLFSTSTYICFPYLSYLILFVMETLRDEESKPHSLQGDESVNVWTMWFISGLGETGTLHLLRRAVHHSLIEKMPE